MGSIPTLGTKPILQTLPGTPGSALEQGVIPFICRYGDGETLYLNVAPGGSKSWVQRVVIDGKRHDIGLGGWPVVSLAKARQRAFASRVAIADGRNPLAEKRKARALTFPTGRSKRSNGNGRAPRSRSTASTTTPASRTSSGTHSVRPGDIGQHQRCPCRSCHNRGCQATVFRCSILQSSETHSR